MVFSLVVVFIFSQTEMVGILPNFLHQLCRLWVINAKLHTLNILMYRIPLAEIRVRVVDIHSASLLHPEILYLSVEYLIVVDFSQHQQHQPQQQQQQQLSRTTSVEENQNGLGQYNNNGRPIQFGAPQTSLPANVPQINVIREQLLAEWQAQWISLILAVRWSESVDESTTPSTAAITTNLSTDVLYAAKSSANAVQTGSDSQSSPFLLQRLHTPKSDGSQPLYDSKWSIPQSSPTSTRGLHTQQDSKSNGSAAVQRGSWEFSSSDGGEIHFSMNDMWICQFVFFRIKVNSRFLSSF